MLLKTLPWLKDWVRADVLKLSAGISSSQVQ